MNNLTSQQKGSLLAFTAVMFITPDSLFIRLSHIDTWGMLFYRGAIPFVVVVLGLLIFYKANFFKPNKILNKTFTVGTVKSIEEHNGIDCLLDAAKLIIHDYKKDMKLYLTNHF